MMKLILTLAAAAVVLGVPRRPRAPRTEVVEDYPEKWDEFIDSAPVKPLKRSVIDDYDYDSVKRQNYEDKAEGEERRNLDTDFEGELKKQERFRRSFNDNGPIALLDQVK